MKKCCVLIVALFACCASTASAATSCPLTNVQLATAHADLDAACPCDGFPSRNAYIKCVRTKLSALVNASQLQKSCKATVFYGAQRSTCGFKPGAATCCKTSNKKGTTSCSVVRSIDKCSSSKSTTAQLGLSSSCFDACSDIETNPEEPNQPDQPNQTEVAKVCSAWKTVKKYPTAPTFAGDSTPGVCVPGQISLDVRTASLRYLNFHRALAGSPLAKGDTCWDRAAQLCSLVVANGGGHFPPLTTACYTPEGAATAGTSNIAGSSDMFYSPVGTIHEGGDVLGHRRWTISKTTTTLGVGATDDRNIYDYVGPGFCMKVFSGSLMPTPPEGCQTYSADPGIEVRATGDWTAWPPPGIVPADVISQYQVGYVFSIQSSKLKVNNGKFKVYDNGVLVPGVTKKLEGNYGYNKYAVSFHPSRDGANPFRFLAGHTITVELGGNIGSAPIRYTTEIVNCS